MNYLFVYLPTNTLDPEVVNAYSKAIEQELLDRWPDAEVDVTTYAHEFLVESDIPDVNEEVVRDILKDIWCPGVV